MSAKNWGVSVMTAVTLMWSGAQAVGATAPQGTAAAHERPPVPADFVPVAVRPEPAPASARGVVDLTNAGQQQEVNPDFGLPDGERWAGDIVVTTFAYAQVEPSMERAPDGTLFLAVEEHGDYDGWVRIWRSVDDGKHWTWTVAFRDFGDSRNPALTVAQNSAGEDYVYVAYHAPGRNAIGVYRSPTSSGEGSFHTVATGLIATDVYPRICTDNSIWQTYYVYVTWTDNYIDYYPALFARSLDYGATWSAAMNLTGGSQNSGWVTQPDIAFGTAGLFVAFEKPAWNGSDWHNEIWVTRSTNFGSSWNTPVQVSSGVLPAYEPSVAATVGETVILAAYTRTYSTDTDIHYAYSTDGGTNWTMNRSLPWTYDNEKAVDVAASTDPGGRFHAAYWRAYDVEYTSATVAAPDAWSPAVRVNEANWASSAYPQPTVCVDERKLPEFEAAIAWTDYRGPYYQAYFDAMYLGCVGDLNCDGQIDFVDINAFVLYLSNQAAWLTTYPDCPPENGDIDGNGTYPAFTDINPFVTLLTMHSLPIVCP